MIPERMIDLSVERPSLATRQLYFSRMLAELEAELPRVEEVAQSYLRRRIAETRDKLRDVENAIGVGRPRSYTNV